MVKGFWDLGASGVGSKAWVLTIGVLKVNPELDSVRAQRGRARSTLFSRVNTILSFRFEMSLKRVLRCQPIW